MKSKNTEPTKMSWEELLSLREKYNAQKEEVEAALSVLSQEFLERLQEEKINGKVVGNWSVSKAIRLSFEVALEKAQELGAVKQVVDQTALKKLYASGVKIDGIKKTEYIMVREVSKSE